MDGQALVSELLPAVADATEGLLCRALEEAVLAHSRLVFRVAYSVLRSREDAEDATQEVFLRVLRFRSRLPEVRDRPAWLARIAWRVATDRLPRRRTVSLDADAPGPARDLASAGASAEEAASDRQVRRLLERAVAELPASLREPLVLSTVEELTSSEVGEVLGLPEGTVRTRLLRARRRLRETLARHVGGKRHG